MYTSFSINMTRSGSYRKLIQPLVKSNRDKQFYFNRLPYLWNSLPPIDLSLSFSCVRIKLIDIFWNSFLKRFNANNHCTYYFSCPCHSCFQQPKSRFTTIWSVIVHSLLSFIVHYNFTYITVIICYYIRLYIIFSVLSGCYSKFLAVLQLLLL